jgi:hypothetical protein
MPFIHRAACVALVCVIGATIPAIEASSAGLLQGDAAGPPWWAPLQLPDQQTQQGMLQRVRSTLASTLDETLPSIPVESWLFETVAPRIDGSHPYRVDWRVTFCGPYAQEPNPEVVTATGPELCAAAAVRLSSDRAVHLLVLVARASRDTLAWYATQAEMRDVYIERLSDERPIDSLDVPRLADLSSRLAVPHEAWPAVRFESSVEWDPPTAMPGETARVRIAVRNIGGRLADRAWIELLISACCGDALEVRRNWFPRIAPGQTVTVEYEVPLPEGVALASVSVRLGPSNKVAHQLDRDKSEAAAAIGPPVR